ncbi:MAG: glutathione S-transferase [Methylococcaceae bacterium]|nr:glutathione S-transferase [Methylococcaceae bacterium]MDD1615058.1 glutathione S-transferase [Methylococcaceae bacterium]OYV21270.1 MAG: Glutathione S-transferase domain protein [Methylococcaceae bacterium NSP1-2]
MINLCGFAVSNYYNKTKLVLLEKGIAFTEEQVFPSQDEAVLKRSPIGKIPFIETEHGCLSESQVILEYLEETYPETPLYPANSFERAKCRELIQHLELNIELHARRLYREAFFGGTVSDETKNEVKELLEKGLKGLARLAKFSPYIAGDTYTAADCVAWLHFFMVSATSQKIYGTDLVAEYLPNVASYMQLIEARPAAQKVATDRAAAMAAFLKK